MPSPTVVAVPPPPGVTPNSQHPPDAGRTTILGGSTVCVTVVFVGFLLRCYAKYSIRQKYTIEDCMLPFLPFSREVALSLSCCPCSGQPITQSAPYLSAPRLVQSRPAIPKDLSNNYAQGLAPLLGYVMITVYNSVGFMMYKHGWGYHAWDLSAYDYSQFMKWLYIQSLLYGPTVFSTKVTLLFLTSRVCSVRRTISKGIHLFIYFLIICYIPLQIVKTIVCLPIEAYWDPEVRNDTAKDVKFLNQGAIFIVDSGVAVVTDATIVVLPLCWAAGILGAGGVAVAVTAYRLPLLFKFERSMDVTAGLVIIGLVCSLEQAIGFVCACLPLLNLFKSRRMTPRRSRLLANVPRTFHHRGKPADGHCLVKKPSPSSIGQSMGNLAAQGEDRRPAGGGTGSEGVSRGTRDTTYDTAWDREANSPGEQRGVWLAASRGSATRGHEQSSENRTVRIANDEPTSSSPLPKPQAVIIRDRIWDGDRTQGSLSNYDKKPANIM
ncbi:uncharacterized protein PG986_011128 [Apiospora aurea]|uniref:Rhodopsin domain-containing protein n=1 Tax=Apiospora aurea TaxID=335848 RepID=A0ABR1Q4E4_9PEZI